MTLTKTNISRRRSLGASAAAGVIGTGLAARPFLARSNVPGPQPVLDRIPQHEDLCEASLAFCDLCGEPLWDPATDRIRDVGGQAACKAQACKRARFPHRTPVPIGFDPNRINFSDTELGARRRDRSQRSAA